MRRRITKFNTDKMIRVTWQSLAHTSAVPLSGSSVITSHVEGPAAARAMPKYHAPEEGAMLEPSQQAGEDDVPLNAQRHTDGCYYCHQQ